MGRIDVFKSREMQAAIVGLRTVDKETQRHVRQVTQKAMAPELQKGMAERLSTSSQPRLSNAVLVRSARVVASNQNVQLRAGTSRAPLSGGLRPADKAAVVEMGARRPVPTKYNRRSKKGGSHTVTRRAMNQLPRYRKQGHIFFPTAKDLIPRFGALWVQTAVRSVHEALEGKQR